MEYAWERTFLIMFRQLQDGVFVNIEFHLPFYSPVGNYIC